MNRTALSLVLASALAVTACDSDTTDTPTPARTKVATATAADLTVELFTDTRLETGMTPIYLSVETAAGLAVTDATVTFVPMMAMGMMSHSAPMLGAPTLGADGLYRCDAVFQMAGSWSATVSVTRPGAPAAEATFADLAVADSGRAKTWVSAADGKKYIMSLNFVAAPKVGLNPVVVTLHWKETDTSFPAVEDASFVLDPRMPAMGHGSPGSVNPTLTSPGVYEGELSFSMPGDWVTTVTASRGGTDVGVQTFATTF